MVGEVIEKQTESNIDVKPVKNGQLIATSSIMPDGKVGTEIRTEFEGISLGDLESMVSGIAGSALGVAYTLARGNQEGIITETYDSRVMFLNILYPAIVNVFNNYVSHQIEKTKDNTESEIVNS